MIRKVLTYLTIFAITALPVQLISASGEFVGMQLSMGQTAQVGEECLHDMGAQVVESELDMPCCDEQANSCESCVDIPQAASAMVLTSALFMKTTLLKKSKISIGHLALNGISQKNLLRPPRIFI